MWTREKAFNFAIIRIQIAFSKFQLPTMSDSSLLSSEASLSSSHSLDSFSNFDKQNHIAAVAWRCFVKKVFLKISQNLQEIVCASVSFLIKLQNFKNFKAMSTNGEILCYREKNEVSDGILNSNFLHFFLHNMNFMHIEAGIWCLE